MRRTAMQVFALPELELAPTSLVFSPDGRQLGVWTWDGALILDLATGAVRAVGERTYGIGRAVGVGFTADGVGFIHPREHQRPPIIVSDVASGAVSRQGPMIGYGGVMRVAPGGRVVYLTDPRYQAGDSIIAWDPLTGEVGAFAPHRDHIRLIGVSADGKWLATEITGAVRVWRLGGAKPPTRATRTFDVFKSWPSGLALSADGAFVALRAAGIGIGNVRTGEWWGVPGHIAGYNQDIAFHPSRPVVAFVGIGGGHNVEVVFYDAAARAELARFAWEMGSVTAPAFSPDGFRCASASRDKVIIWDVDF